MPHLNLDGNSFFYQQTGDGPDVVLIHAVTSNLAVWMFINLLETLGGDYRVTAYDLRGHGLSDAPPSGYTSADMAWDFRLLHEALALGPAYLVGHSFGGVVAMHAASLYPERVAGVILSDSYFPGLGAIEPNLGETNVWLDLKQTFAVAGVELGEQVDFTTLFQLVAGLTAEQMSAIRREMGAPSVRWLSQLPRLATTTCGADVFAVAGLTAERLASIRQPVVALYDEHTPFAATRDWLAEHLPHCTLDVVPGAKHLAPLQNAEAFVALIQKHLGTLKEPTLAATPALSTQE